MSTIPATAQDERFEWDQQLQEQRTPEPHAESARRLVRSGLWTIALLAIATLALCELHYRMLLSEIARKQAATVNTQLMATRLRDAKMLSRCQWIKPSEGVLRIPESLAVRLVIADYSKQGSPASVPSVADIAPTVTAGKAGAP